MLGRTVILLSLALASGLAAGFLGALHPAGDTAAVFRLYLGPPLALCAAALLRLGRRRAAVAAALAAALALAPVLQLPGPVATAGGGAFGLYQKNMMFRMSDPQALAADILARTPDFVTLQEVSGANLAILDALERVYPSQHFCPFATVGGVAVASRWPVIEGSARCAEKGGLAAMQLDTPAGPVWLVSVHLHWPWPHGQARHAARLVPVLSALNGPMAIGGDFNMVPWAHRLAAIERLTGTGVVGPPRVTLTRNGWLRVPIDHVLVTGGQGVTERLPLIGSDHHGIFARFSLPGGAD